MQCLSQRKQSVNSTTIIIIFKAEETAGAWRFHLVLRGLWAGSAEVAVREREKRGSCIHEDRHGAGCVPVFFT